MTAIGHDTLKSRRTLTVEGKGYDYFSLPEAAKTLGDISRLPVSLKVLLENVLRFEDGRSYKVDDAKAIVGWLEKATSSKEVPFKPARILMQDFTGVPAVVDLAAMRDGITRLGGNPAKVNPLVPVDLVIDHSVMVDVFGRPDALQKNVDIEFERNGERYQFLRWGQDAFDNFRVVPPGTGHLPPGEPGISWSVRVDVDQRRDDLRLSGHAVWHRQPHHDGERAGHPRLGRRRHRGRGGHAGPADRHADPGRDRLPADRQDGRGRHRHRPGADRHADAAQEGRGRQIRRVLRAGAGRSGPAGSRDDRQYGAGIWRHLRVLPGGQGRAGLSAAVRPRYASHRAGGGVSEGSGHVP